VDESCFLRAAAIFPETRQVSSYGKGPFGKSYLQVDLGEDTENRYLVVGEVLHEIVRFWEKFFADNNIEPGSSNPEP